jgi:hypothetical protein
MKATKDEMDARAADYADEFDQPDKQPRQMSDDEAFGLSEPAAAEGAAPEGSAAEEAAESPAEEAAEGPAGEAAEAAPAEASGEGEAAPSPADQEQRLKSWEGRLKARQAELDAREAAMGSSDANDEQGSEPMGEEGAGGGDQAGEGEGGGGDDPAAVLADDFGQDFVEQITRLIKKVAQECGGMDPRVDQVIEALQNERLNNHFNTIAQTHADFMDVVESPEFAAWKGEQPDQDRLQQVIDSGSARQIIDMLTAFKNATKKTDSQDYHEDALDAAEGVRSSGLTLPKEPAASDDFAKAWNEA